MKTEHELIQSKKLPEGWIICNINDIYQFVPTGVEKYKGEIKYFSTGSIKNQTFDAEGKYSFEERPSRANRYSKVGDVFQAKMRETNKPLIITQDLENKLFSTGFLHFRPYIQQKELSEYLYYYIQSPSFLRLRDSFATGSTQIAITDGKAKTMKIILPPLKEQKRIVSKIEKLFSELDNVKVVLERNMPQLKQYQQLLLKYAFEGKLTEKWRKKHKVNLDSILKKIELGRKNQDKKLRDIKTNKNYDFFNIPKEWKWIHVGEILKEIQYGTSEKATTAKSKIPVLRMGNIQDGELNFDNLKYYPENWKNFKQFVLEEGDVLFNRTNSAELVGKTAVYKDYHQTAVFAGYLIRLKIFPETYIPSLLSYYINSIFGKSYIKSVVTQQVGQANVNATKLFMMKIPLMSFEEQKEIFSQLELYFSLIKNTENITNSMLSQLDILRSNILKHAFEGILVSQDPNDEPAEFLLKKITKNKINN